MSAARFDLVTLGESMWRLSTPGHERLATARSLELHIGGCESNLAIALARLGKHVAWWSRLPHNALGEHLARTLRGLGVDISGICYDAAENARLGTYFIEFGSAPRPTRVIYDRAGSSASCMQPDDFDWSLLRQTHRLHLSGITPALSPSCLATVRRAIREARAAGTDITLDLNYRANLWSWKACRPIMDELAADCDLVICAARDARSLLQSTADAKSLLCSLHQRWQRPNVVITQGAGDTLACDGRTVHAAPAFQNVRIVDRIGAGDAFAAGLHCALLDGLPWPQALRFGNAVAALKLTMSSDIALVSHAEVDELLASDAVEIRR